MSVAAVYSLASRRCSKLNSDASFRGSRAELVYMLMQLGNAITISVIRQVSQKDSLEGGVADMDG